MEKSNLTTQIGIGFSQNPSAVTAVEEAAIEAKKQAQEQVFDLVIIFCTTHYPPAEIIKSAQSNFQKAKIIGSSTAGIILPEKIKTQGIAVLAIKSQDINFGVGSVENLVTKKLSMVGNELVQNTIADFGEHRRQLFLFFTDGLIENNSLMIKGIRETLGSTVPIIGVGSSDDFRFRETYQFSNNKSLLGTATGLMMGGQLRIGLGLKHGWKPLGKPRTITKVRNHIVKEIDSLKASHIYEEYFGAEIRNLRQHQLTRMAMLYPLGIYIENEEEYLLRYVLDILSDGSIVTQGDVPEDTQVQIMIGNKDSYKEAAVEAAKEARHSLLGKQPKLYLVFESLSRHKLLGRGALLEIQMIREVFGYTTPMIGMYSYGEIGPLKPIDSMGEPYLQNNMIMILAIL